MSQCASTHCGHSDECRPSNRKVILIVVTAIILALGSWYVLSPRWALSALADWEGDPKDLTALYDRNHVRAAFEQQMLPQVDTYRLPLNKDVILDALSDPRAIRMLVTEPYGEWQFAAAAGLPSRLMKGDPPVDMPRALETTHRWSFKRSGVKVLIATPSGRRGTRGNSYHFKREGLKWRLVAIELTTKIR